MTRIKLNPLGCFATLFAAALTLSAPSVTAQEESKPLGKIIYLEGKVEIWHNEVWQQAKMNHLLYAANTMRTPGNGMSEVQWNDGTKTIIGPGSEISIGILAERSSSAKTENQQNLMSNFKRMFMETADATRKEEGGIRRSKGESITESGNDGLFWKQEREISFDDASAIYAAGDYVKAISALHAFLQQKPDHDQAPMALAALGQAYIEVNNPLKAAEIFQDFLQKYPTHSAGDDVRQMLAQL
jgi:TolA-binding protein